MTRRAVVIAGGGPTGLRLAGELALAGVDVVIVERRPSQDLIGSRSGGLQSRTIEVFDQRGIADRFLAQGQKAGVSGTPTFVIGTGSGNSITGQKLVGAQPIDQFKAVNDAQLAKDKAPGRNVAKK